MVTQVRGGGDGQAFLFEEACPFIVQSVPLTIVLLTIFNGKVGVHMHSIQPSMSMVVYFQ